VQAELWSHEEEQRNMAKKQRNSSTEEDSGNWEHLQSLESQVFRRKSELHLLKQEVRILMQDLRESKEGSQQSNLAISTSAEGMSIQKRRPDDVLMDSTCIIARYVEVAAYLVDHRGRNLPAGQGQE
jgi:hypothetical protein